MESIGFSIGKQSWLNSESDWQLNHKRVLYEDTVSILK